MLAQLQMPKRCQVEVAVTVLMGAIATVEVLDTEVIAYLHLTCADRIGSAVAPSSAGAER